MIKKCNMFVAQIVSVYKSLNEIFISVLIVSIQKEKSYKPFQVNVQTTYININYLQVIKE